MKPYALIAAAVVTLLPVHSFAQADKLQTTDCATARDQAICKSQAQQVASDWKKANKGDYASQRNIAFCFKNGCDGSTKVDAVAACSWRMVIQAADNDKDVADGWSYDADCKPLANADRRTALNQAEKLFKRIYGKQMPIERLLRN